MVKFKLVLNLFATAILNQVCVCVCACVSKQFWAELKYFIATGRNTLHSFHLKIVIVKAVDVVFIYVFYNYHVLTL